MTSQAASFEGSNGNSRLEARLRALNAYLPGLERLAIRVLRDQSAAEEVISKLRLRFLTRQELPTEDMERILANQVRTSCFNERRAQNRRRDAERTYVEQSTRGESASIRYQRKAQACAALSEAVAELPADQQELITLHYIEEKSVREVASLLAISPATVSRQCNAAISALRRKLEDRNGGDGLRTTLLPLAFPGLRWVGRSGPLGMLGVFYARILVSATPAKLAAVASVLLLLGVGIWSFIGDPHSGSGSIAGPARLTPTVAELVPAPASEPPLEVTSRPFVAPTLGSLRVQVLRDGVPQPDVAFNVQKATADAWVMTLRRGRTDANGEALIENYPAGPVRVTTDTGFEQPATIVADACTEVQIPIINAFDLSGTVTDPLGNPVANASLSVISTNIEDLDSPTWKTNQDGQYSLRGLAPGSRCLMCRKAGWAPIEFYEVVGPRASPHRDIKFRYPGAQLHLRVLDTSGNAIRNSRLAMQFNKVDFRSRLHIATSSSEGLVVIDGLEAGYCQVRCFTLEMRAVKAVILLTEKATEAQLQLGYLAVVHGEVRESKTGKVVPGAYIAELGRDLHLPDIVVSDDLGQFLLPLDEAEEVEIRAWAPGSGCSAVRFAVTSDVKSIEWNPTLDDSATVRLLLTTSDGKPLREVTAVERVEGMPTFGSELTGPEGVLEVFGLDSGREYCMELDVYIGSAKEKRPPITLKLSVKADGTTREVVIPDCSTNGTSMKGRLVDSAYRALEGERIRARLVDNGHPDLEPRYYSESATNHLGEFDIKNVPDGLLGLDCFRSDGCIIQLGNYTLQPGLAHDCGTILVQPYGSLRVKLPGSRSGITEIWLDSTGWGHHTDLASLEEAPVESVLTIPSGEHALQVTISGRGPNYYWWSGQFRPSDSKSLGLPVLPPSNTTKIVSAFEECVLIDQPAICLVPVELECRRCPAESAMGCQVTTTRHGSGSASNRWKIECHSSWSSSNPYRTLVPFPAGVHEIEAQCSTCGSVNACGAESAKYKVSVTPEEATRGTRDSQETLKIVMQ